MHIEREGFMKTYLKLGLTVLLIAAFCLLSGFRAQTIIHDDGSETQDVLKVSESAAGQKKLRADADEFQKRNYTIMDYDNDNGKIRPVYTTFKRVAEDTWEYCGSCFRGENVQRGKKLSYV